MSASPIEVVGYWLQHLLDPDAVNSVVAPDAVYVSLNTDNAELNKIMPWAGTSRGPQAFLDNLVGMFSRWENQAFNVTTMFASDENVAVFGDFRYRSKSLDKVVSSPFSILANVVNGKVTYLQFQEDSYATAASFRKAGSWTVQTEARAAPFEVGQYARRSPAHEKAPQRGANGCVGPCVVPYGNKGEPMITPETEKDSSALQIVRTFITTWNTHNVSAITQLLDPDIVFRSPCFRVPSKASTRVSKKSRTS